MTSVDCLSSAGCRLVTNIWVNPSDWNWAAIVLQSSGNVDGGSGAVDPQTVVDCLSGSTSWLIVSLSTCCRLLSDAMGGMMTSVDCLSSAGCRLVTNIWVDPSD